MQTPRLFTKLPEYICTPDGMEIDRDGNLILSCPNYAELAGSGCVVKIDKDRKVTKWFDVPVHPETGVARNMGIAFDSEWNLYICDNQGWSEAPELMFKGRVLKFIFDENGDIKESIVVADGMEHPNGNLYIADFCANAIARVSPDGKVTRIAQSPDTDGLNGELDQPGEPIIWDGKIIVSCFDLVTGPGKVNTAHEMPATMSELDLE